MIESPTPVTAEVRELPTRHLTEEQRALAGRISAAIRELEFFLQVLKGEPIKKIDDNVLLFEAKVIVQDKPRWLSYIPGLSKKLNICRQNVTQQGADKVFRDLLTEVGDVREVVFANFYVKKADVDAYVQKHSAQVIDIDSRKI